MLLFVVVTFHNLAYDKRSMPAGVAVSLIGVPLRPLFAMITTNVTRGVMSALAIVFDNSAILTM